MLRNLPIDLIAEVESYLGPEDKSNLSTAFKRKSTAYDNRYWEVKFKRHFPHRRITDPEPIDWQAQFGEAYRDEYYDETPLLRKQRRLFSLVKDGDVGQLMELRRNMEFNFADIKLADRNGISLLFWAKKNNDQRMLDFFYKLEETQSVLKYRTLLRLAILTNQKAEIIQEFITRTVHINNFYREGYSCLHLAAWAGRADVVQMLINAGANVNFFTKMRPDCEHDGITALDLAIVNGHQNVVDILLKHGAHITTKPIGSAKTDETVPFQPDNFYRFYNLTPGDTSLLAAIRTGNGKIVEAILKKNPFFRTNNTSEIAAIYLAIDLGFDHIIQLLIDHKININKTDDTGCTPLFYAAAQGRSKIVELLLQHKAQIDNELQVDDFYHHSGIKFDKGDTPLIAALRVNQPDIALMILNKIGKSQSTSYMLRSALILAAREGFTDVVQELLRMGVDINTCAEGGGDALFYSIVCGHKATFDHLLENKAHLMQVISRSICSFKGNEPVELLPGEGPLMAAVKLNRVDMIAPLFNRIKTLPNSYEHCLAAFKYAAETDKSEIVHTFIECGFNPEAFLSQKKVEKTDSAFYTAIQSDNFAIAEGMLIKQLHGTTDYNISPAELEFALRAAAIHGRITLAELLIQMHVDVNAQTASGATALLYAVENKHTKIVELLLQHNAKISIPLNSDHSHHAQFKVEMGDNPLIAAIKNDCFDIVRLLVDKIITSDAEKADSHDSDMGDGGNEGDKDPTLDLSGTKTISKGEHDQILPEHLEQTLRWAAITGQVDIVTKLLDYGVDVNARSSCGATALLFAVEHGHEKVVDVLLEYHANVDISLKQKHDYHKQFNVKAGDTPLHVAAKHNKANILVKLLNKTDNVEHLNNKQQTAFQLSEQNSRCQASFQLFSLWHKMLSQETTGQRKTTSLFGQTLFVKASSQEIQDAAEDVIEVLKGNADKKILDKHRVALRSPELAGIYRNLRIS